MFTCGFVRANFSFAIGDAPACRSDLVGETGAKRVSRSGGLIKIRRVADHGRTAAG
jgi:hypothetical protein